MKKEYVVVRIDAAPDGAPYVIISLSSAKDLKEGNQPPSGPNANIMGFSNMDDMMKGLNKMLAGGMPGGMGGFGGMAGNQTALKVDMHEYKELGLSVGDKVYLELSKAESLGV